MQMLSHAAARRGKSIPLILVSFAGLQCLYEGDAINVIVEVSHYGLERA